MDFSISSFMFTNCWYKPWLLSRAWARKSLVFWDSFAQASVISVAATSRRPLPGDIWPGPSCRKKHCSVVIVHSCWDETRRVPSVVAWHDASKSFGESHEHHQPPNALRRGCAGRVPATGARGHRRRPAGGEESAPPHRAGGPLTPLTSRSRSGHSIGRVFGSSWRRAVLDKDRMGLRHSSLRHQMRHRLCHRSQPHVCFGLGT